MSRMTDADKDTYITRFRIPRSMWDAYGRVTERDGSSRSADLLDHVRAVIQARGDKQDLADLQAAEQELADRRSRKGGRPPRKSDTTEETRA
jgi:hypothetical protein